MHAPWLQLSRRLAAQTLIHWRTFMKDQPPEPMLPAMHRVREARAKCAKHVKSIALARARPSHRQIEETLGWARRWANQFGLSEVPDHVLDAAMRDYALRFVGSDFAPKFARRMVAAIRASM